MPLYAIKGLHRDDASPLAPLTIKAATEDEAVKIANAKGIVVESAERVVHRTPPWLVVLLAITLLLIMGGLASWWSMGSNSRDVSLSQVPPIDRHVSKVLQTLESQGWLWKGD